MNTNKLLGKSKLLVMKSDFIGEVKPHLEVASALVVASCPDCGQVGNQEYNENEDRKVPSQNDNVFWYIERGTSNTGIAKYIF